MYKTFFILKHHAFYFHIPVALKVNIKIMISLIRISHISPSKIGDNILNIVVVVLAMVDTFFTYCGYNFFVVLILHDTSGNNRASQQNCRPLNQSIHQSTFFYL